MRARIVSLDKVGCEVLGRALAAHQFEAVVTVAPGTASAPSRAGGAELVHFVDFDAENARDELIAIGSEGKIIPFGAHAVRGRVPEILAATFLVKPFSAEQVEKVVRATLLADVALAARESGALGDARDKATLARDWRRVLDVTQQRRAEVVAALEATPDELRVKLQGKAPGPISLELLPVQHALVIDRDASAGRSLTRYLARKCVMQVDVATDGRKALKMMQARAYDVVVLSWDLEGPSGLALYNRLRMREKTRYLPLLITTSKLKAHDFRLLDEDFCAGVLENPVPERAFSAALGAVVASAVLTRDKLEELVALACESIAQPGFAGNPRAFGLDADDQTVLNALRLAGDRMLAADRVAAAEAAYGAAWSLGDRRLALLTGYAKARHLAGKHDEARDLLGTADALAPHNVERLCLLGEVGLFLRDPAGARRAFEKALAIDDGAQAARSGLEVAEGMRAQGQAGELHSLRFVSYLNLVGINLARAGRTAEALRHYRAALAFVRGADDSAKLWFNVGLCNLRAHRADAAKKAFQHAYEVSGGALGKARRYYADVETMAVGEGDQDDIPFERF